MQEASYTKPSEMLELPHAEESRRLRRQAPEAAFFASDLAFTVDPRCEINVTEKSHSLDGFIDPTLGAASFDLAIFITKSDFQIAKLKSVSSFFLSLSHS